MENPLRKRGQMSEFEIRFLRFYWLSRWHFYFVLFEVISFETNFQIAILSIFRDAHGVKFKIIDK